MIFLWVVVGVLCLLTAVCLLALIDQFRTLELIRTKIKLEDTPEPLPLPRERSLLPSSVGLPQALDRENHLVVLFLSTTCTTCRTIADGLRSASTASVWVVMEHARTVEEGLAWLATSGISAERVTVDVGGRIAEGLGITVTPSMVLYQSGEAALAQTVPSYRQLEPLLSARTLPQPLKPQSLKPQPLKYAKEGTIRV
ncbi:hypothetical protein [Sinosporangium siamense]|uniref:Thioredoxin domain-containing protein n=1 Tax=Sinosporangium siamense TaxID=1367973 RepID=A0A919RMZ4_9ACTN|nr:hypothetical protein [Sinosporangium siamense]GII95825.1 hypothetical protein Ssi02_60560 [Sinosporangium siamense]